MAFCLPRAETNKFLQAVKDGRINPDDLMNMDSAGRRAFFEDIVGKDNAHEVNAAFEGKMVLKDQQRGFYAWGKSMSGLSAPVRRDFIDRVSKLDHVLNPEEEKAFLSDLVEKKLGVGVSADEARTISELAKKAQETRDTQTENFSGVSDDALNAANHLRAYLASLKPVTPLGALTKDLATIARNHLLMNPATPIKTTVGQSVNSVMDYFTRRIGTVLARGANPELAIEANKQAWETFYKTGMNVAAMESLDDTGRLGEGKRFDVKTGTDTGNKIASTLETGVRKYAEVTNKVVIDWAHVVPFTKFYQKAFYDMADLLASKVAASEGAKGDVLQTRAAEIFKDAARVVPKTREGAIVRNYAQKQAARVTSTNDTVIGKFALKVKDALNSSVTGLGDAIMPIAKIPANIIWNGIENAGVGVPLGIKDLLQGHAKLQSDDLEARTEGLAQFAFGVQRLARTFGSIALAAYLTSLLKKQDFRQDHYGATYVRLGNVWINLEYVSFISPALAGMMTVKAKGRTRDSVLNTAGQYVAGVAAGLKNAPGMTEVDNAISDLTNPNFVKGIGKYASDFFTSRGVPAFVHSLDNNRPINRLFFGAHGVETQTDVYKDKAQAHRKERGLMDSHY